MNPQEARSEAIGHLLDRLAGENPDVHAVVEAMLSTWRQLSTRLVPVIGERGVEAVFSRSLQLTGVAFPWLSVNSDGQGRATPLAGFAASLETREPATAAAASLAFLVIFTHQLDTLIGESLTERLLGLVWASPAQCSEREAAP